MKGFTLIETIIYIALLGLIMGGTLLAVYQILEGGASLSGKAVVQGEGNFLLRKLDWALSGDSSIPTVGGSGCSQTLSITKTGFSPNPIDIRLNAGAVEMREGGIGFGTYEPLTTSNVAVSCLQFRVLPAVGTGPAGIAATTTINGFEFATTKYLRI